MSDQLRVQGNILSWGSLKVKVDGDLFTGFTSISWDHKRERTKVWGPRDLRRSHGSILRQAGIEPHLIGKMLGHADSRMVEKTYGQLPPDALAALMKKRFKKRSKGTGTKTVQKGTDQQTTIADAAE